MTADRLVHRIFFPADVRVVTHSKGVTCREAADRENNEKSSP